uniref:Reverse transcriptase domain-containing protein n=1 Tax=Fagus sylvatica TaxID=28930 RepID=A0A2N9GQ01_FAGSY
MAGKTSGPGPSEQEIRMVTLERKFDELLSFVQLIAKRTLDGENQRKEDDKDTNSEEPEGHSNTNTTPPRPPTPPKPEGKDSQLDSKIDSLEEKIRLIQGFELLRKHRLLQHVLVPQHDDIPRHPDRARSRMVLAVEEDLSLEGAGGYLPGPIRWREKAARACPPLDEREMIKIFVDTLKNPYFDRMIGLQMQFFVDLIPVGERIEDAVKTKKIVDMTALMALAEQAAKKAPTKKKEGDVQMIGRNSGRPRQALPTFTMQPIQPRPAPIPVPTQVPAPSPTTQIPARPAGNQVNDNRLPRKEPRQFTLLPMPLTELYPILIEKNLISPTIPMGHAVENCNHLRHRIQDLIDHGILKFEGLPNITTNPLPNHPEGGVNMVEIEEEGDRIDSAGDRILWRRLFHTLEKQGHITPLEAPPGPSIGDACEYHSGARGHSLECCEEFKKEVSNLMEKGLVRREKIPSEGSRQPYDPSDLDWYAELNLDDIVEDEMDLDDLMDEGDAQGYFMEDDTDEWRDVDFSELLQFPCLIAPSGFETLEFEIFYENGNPEVHLQKYGEKMALHVENELLMISVFPESLSRQAAAWFYQLKGPYRRRRASNATTTTAEEEHADPLVEGLSIHAITEEGDSTTPPIRYCQQGEEAMTWTSMPLLQHISSSNEIARKTSNDPHVSKIDNKADCSLDNIDNSDEEVELPNDILEALERQDEGSKPNIEELEIINLADGGEEPREVKIGTRSTTEQKEALIALLREFHEIFAWSYQDMPGLDTDIVVHKIPLKPECKPVKQALRRMKPEVILKIKEEVEKQLKAGFLSTVTYSDWVANIVPATNAVFSFMDGFSGYNQIKMAEEDKSKTAFVTHWGTFVYDVMPFGLKNAGATYQRAMVTLFHDMIHHEIEVYVDDMIAKSRTTQDHLTDLRKLFQRLKKYQLRLNPNKCAFGVTSGKLLGFIFSGKGIEIDPAKVQAIRSMPAPKTEKEIPKLLGKDQLHSSLHCTAHCNLRAFVQVVEKRREDKVDRGLPESF